MQELVNAIKKVRQNILLHKTYLTQGHYKEFHTRYVLIDPILTALGWDVHDPSKVLLEFSEEEVPNRADYSLLNTEGKALAFVEAKCLYNIRNAYNQVMKHVREIGYVQYGIATDGKTWILGDAFRRELISKTEILNFDIETSSEELLLEFLGSLAPNNLYKGDKAVFPTIEPVNNAKPVLAPQVSASLPVHVNNSVQTDGITLTQLREIIRSTEDFNKKGKPKKVKFPNEELKFLPQNQKDAYGELLRAIAEYMIKLGKLQSLELPMSTYRGAVLIDKNKDNVPKPERLKGDTELYLSFNANREMYLNNTLHLLSLCGENPDKYFILF